MCFPVTGQGKHHLYISILDACYWDDAAVVKDQEGKTYCYKEILNPFLSILSSEMFFFPLRIPSRHYASEKTSDGSVGVRVAKSQSLFPCYDLQCY